MMKKLSIPSLALAAAVLTGCGSLQADRHTMAPEWPNLLAECDVATKVHQYSYGSLAHCAQQAVQVAAQPQVQWPEGDKESFLKTAGFAAMVAEEVEGTLFAHNLREANDEFDITAQDKAAAEKELTPLICEALREVEAAPVTVATDGRIAGLVGDKYVEVGEAGVEIYDPKERHLPAFGEPEDIHASEGWDNQADPRAGSGFFKTLYFNALSAFDVLFAEKYQPWEKTRC